MANKNKSGLLQSEERIAIVRTVKEILQEEKKNELQEKRQTQIANVRFALENYRRFKSYVPNAVISIIKAKSVLEEMLQTVLDLDDDELKVQSIIETKEKTLIMIAQIETGIKSYKSFCEYDSDANAMRRYNIIYDRYISDYKHRPSIDSLAKKYFVERRTVFSDISKACYEMGPYIYGTLWL